MACVNLVVSLSAGARERGGGQGHEAELLPGAWVLDNVGPAEAEDACMLLGLSVAGGGGVGVLAGVLLLGPVCGMSYVSGDGAVCAHLEEQAEQSFELGRVPLAVQLPGGQGVRSRSQSANTPLPWLRSMHGRSWPTAKYPDRTTPSVLQPSTSTRYHMHGCNYLTLFT